MKTNLIKKYAAGFLSAFAILTLPVMASAQLVGNGPTGNLGGVGGTLTNIGDFINNVLVPFILAIAFLAFVWGVFTFFIAGGANEEKRESGKNLMIYAVAGFVLIIIFWGVVNLIASSIGLENQDIANSQPAVPNIP